ncbi:MAG: hypothetical protein QM692_18820 [Thermomicrobiales bacterium]
MDTHAFDTLARTLASRGTRRTLAASLLALPVTATLLAAPDAADAKRRKKKRKKKGSGKTAPTPQPSPTCPECPADQHCVNGACVAGCQPTCDGKACGANDGCGGTCQTGACPDCQTCESGACVAVANGTACDDGNFCTLTSCQSGACTVVNRMVCNQPRNPCRVSTCNPATGGCEEGNQPERWYCASTNVCSVPSGQCDGAGTCVAAPIECTSPRICCASGAAAGACKLPNDSFCNSNSECCSGNCFGYHCM